jgi:adenosylcobinamide-GDP ribazoletransferase
MHDFLRALSLLTILPVRARWDEDTPPGRAMACYPLVGAAIGAALALLAYLLRLAGLPDRGSLLAAGLLLAAWAGLTGALHLDGWADCCDALFVPVSRERRLEILRDPRLGSFGVAGLVLLLLVKLAALQNLTAGPVEPAIAALILIPACARWALVLAAAASPLARGEGMAFYFRQSLGRREALIATGTAALAAALAWIVLGPASLALAAATVAAMLAVRAVAIARLGGLTGDVYGAIVELAETAALVVACFV